MATVRRRRDGDVTWQPTTANSLGIELDETAP